MGYLRRRGCVLPPALLPAEGLSRAGGVPGHMHQGTVASGAAVREGWGSGGVCRCELFSSCWSRASGLHATPGRRTTTTPSAPLRPSASCNPDSASIAAVTPVRSRVVFSAASRNSSDAQAANPGVSSAAGSNSSFKVHTCDSSLSCSSHLLQRHAVPLTHIIIIKCCH
jgi:hypothetical protein